MNVIKVIWYGKNKVLQLLCPQYSVIDKAREYTISIKYVDSFRENLRFTVIRSENEVPHLLDIKMSA